MRDEALPESWLFLKLSEVGTWRGGGTPSKANPAFWSGGTIPWVSPKDMKQPKLSAAQDFITESAVESSATNLVGSGSVLLVTRSGILAHSLPVAVNLVPVALNQDIKAVTPYPFVDADFLHLLFQGFERDILNECRKGGTTVHSIEFPSLQNFTIPLPPLAEQKRIVAKIEELFSELDAGEESLRVARRQLGVYRQSLLKQAFEGKLTEKWRTQNPHLLESPEQLLKRIQASRTAKGLRPSKTIPEVIDCTREKLPAIPSEWHWLRLEHVAIIGTGMSVSQARTYDDAVEVPYLRVANVQRGRLDLTEIRTMLVERSRLDELKVKAGDVLFNEGGDRDKLGRGWVWNGQIDPCITQNHVFRATAISTTITVPEYISHWGNAFGQDFFHLTGKQTTNLASISKATLSSLPVPLPPFEEQKEILRLLDEQFEAIERNEREIDAALRRSEALRQAILKKAFTGQLVAQDPADEPASALLERIREQKMNSGRAQPPTKKRSKVERN